MKKSEIKILLVEIFLILATIFNIFVFNVFSETSISIVLILMFFAVALLLGVEKDNFVGRTDNLMTIIIFIISYYLFIYILGIFTGFVLNGYSLHPINIVRNIAPVLFFQISKELLRYEINIKGQENKILLILSTILFILVDVSSVMFMYDLTDHSDVLKLVELNFIPFIAENILMTYLSLKVGYKATILYQILMTIPYYIIPIIPDINTYIDVIFRLVLPSMMLYTFARKPKKHSVNEERRKKKYSKVGYGLTLAFLVVIVYLTCGLFKFYALSIGSESMSPYIDKGDVVIVKKTKDYDKLEIGNILVYKKNDRVVVHRISQVIKDKDQYIFTTKGDANPTEDGYPIYENEVIGTVQFRIKLLGWPTVWINEFVNG